VTENDLRALRLLVTQTRLIGPQHFGTLLWPNTRVGGSNCSAPLARSAGKVLNRLKARGYAEWTSERDPTTGRATEWGWHATRAGRGRI
jgi:hypothetical protein